MPMGGAFIKEVYDEIKSEIIETILKTWNSHPELWLNEILKLCDCADIKVLDIPFSEFNKELFMRNESFDEYVIKRI